MCYVTSTAIYLNEHWKILWCDNLLSFSGVDLVIEEQFAQKSLKIIASTINLCGDACMSDVSCFLVSPLMHLKVEVLCVK